MQWDFALNEVTVAAIAGLLAGVGLALNLQVLIREFRAADRIAGDVTEMEDVVEPPTPAPALPPAPLPTPTPAATPAPLPSGAAFWLARGKSAPRD